MSKFTKTQEINDSQDYIDDDIQDDDYVFVVRADGTLKSVLLPDEENTFNPPEEIKKILAVYNIMDVDELSEPKVLH